MEELIDSKPYVWKEADMYKALSSARILLVTSGHLDASPRIMTEALALNMALLVNRNLLAGTQYVNDRTGVFFTDENDVVEAYHKVQKMINEGKIDSRNWVREYTYNMS